MTKQIGFLVFILFPSTFLVKGSNARHRRRLATYGTYGNDAIDRIVCTAGRAEFNSILGIPLIEPYGNSCVNALGAVMIDNFKTASIMQCDPYQRSITSSNFSQFYPSSTDQTYALYQITVSSCGVPTPTETALTTSDVIYVNFTKEPTGEVCSIPQILDITTNNCPREGCYCPQTLIAQEDTTGVSERMFASSLNESLPSCPNGGKRGLDTKYGSGASTCTNCKIRSVSELRYVEPCEASSFFTFNFTVVTTLSVDPCTLGNQTLNKFLDQMETKYNWAQVLQCDASFRQMQLPYLKQVCQQNQRRRLASGSLSFLWGGTSSSSKESTLTNVNIGRRLLGPERHQSQSSSSADEIPITTSYGPRKLSSSLPPAGSPLCLCSAFVGKLTGGITNGEFLRMANETMQNLTNGKVSVTNQFELGSCPSQQDRYSLQTDAIVQINKDVSTLSKQQIAELEKSCVSQYNAYIIEQCPETYPILTGCLIEPYYELVSSGGRRRLSLNNRLLYKLFGTSGVRDESAFANSNISRRRRDLGQSARHNRDPEALNRLLQSSFSPNPKGLCLCRVRASPGQKPTVEQFASLINGTGIVESAASVEQQYCGSPTGYGQPIYVEAVGNLNDPNVVDGLEQLIQDTLNSLSIELCVMNHFYIYSLDLNPNKANNKNASTLQFYAHYLAYNVENGDPTLFASDELVQGLGVVGGGRALSARRIETTSQRELQIVVGSKNCYCPPGVTETDLLPVSIANLELNKAIAGGAVPGLSFARILSPVSP